MQSLFDNDPKNSQLKQDILTLVTKETQARQSSDTRAVLRQIIHSHEPKKYYFYTTDVNGQLETKYKKLLLKGLEVATKDSIPGIQIGSGGSPLLT